MELAKPGFTPKMPKKGVFQTFIEDLFVLLLRALILMELWNYYIVPYFRIFKVTYLLMLVVVYMIRLTIKRK